MSLRSDKEVITVDFLIIGSGAGGAAAFDVLTKSTNNVLLLEEGYDQTANYGREISWITRNLYRGGGVNPIIGLPPIAFAEGKLLGGTTEINGGLFWRTPEKIADHWDRHLGLPLLSSQSLSDNFEYFENVLNVSLQEEIEDSDSDSKLMKIGAGKLGWNVVPVPRLVPKCQRANRCGSGCPGLRKQSMSQTLLPLGKSRGGRILQGFKVVKINYKKSKAISVFAQNQSDNSYIEVKFKNLIVACGVFQTPKLLFKSKMMRTKFVGAQLHVNLKFLATWEHKLRSNQGTIFTSQVQEFMDEGFIFMPTNFSREYLAIGFSSVNNEEFTEIMEQYEQSALMTSQVRIRSKAWITNLSIPPLIFWGRKDIKLIKRSAEKMCELLFASGAKEVILPFSGASMKSLHECKSAIASSSFRNWALQSVHAMSSCGMALNNRSVTDSYGRLRRFDNVHLVDASVLPTNMGESPQGTIMAVSKMIVDNILQTGNKGGLN